MRELDLEAVALVGIVKLPFRHNEVSHLLINGREDKPVYLDSHSLILRLLQMIAMRPTVMRSLTIESGASCATSPRS